jgi:hypothetical protein
VNVGRLKVKCHLLGEGVKTAGLTTYFNLGPSCGMCGTVRLCYVCI